MYNALDEINDTYLNRLSIHNIILAHESQSPPLANVVQVEEPCPQQGQNSPPSPRL